MPGKMPTVATLAAIIVSAGTAFGSTLSPPTYIGDVTGNPERDTFGTIMGAAQTQLLCITGPARYFGPVTGNPERDNYAYETTLTDGLVCPPKAATTSQR